LVNRGFWFIQGFGLYRIPGLFSSLVYTGFWFIQGFGLNRILVYSGFGSYRIQVYSGVSKPLNKPESCINQIPE
jgi:hypothetical protein